MEKSAETSLCICPKFEKAFMILGKKWSGLIIEVLLTGDRRFKEIAAEIPDVSDRVLVERLKELEEKGIVIRTERTEGLVKVMYGLSQKGKDLEVVMKEIQNWSDKWITVET
ncbi:HTH-type transcriptional regulator YodB [Jeotgalibaca dankookensis]|uniref:HTH-type transcriptional regulator YodB n=1 Tax=Jeotgalibaca dankookensis TaxID=708126 RepID=A0A1S6IP73_9LACT|nr:helix-turn-helix domain-containing protein [Jeotgalibaca dankookensis]AQS53338.1 HTH-type transcriptional regulator YodB [Jeotgalibaca dankookensis]